MRLSISVICLLTGLLIGAVPTMAQQLDPTIASPASPLAAPPADTVAVVEGADPAAPLKGLTGRMLLPRDAFSPDGAPVTVEVLAARSLLFTPTEVGSIVTTLMRVNRRAVADPEAPPAGPDENGLLPGMPGYVEPLSEEAVPSYPPIPTKRTITLSGVLLRKPGDWVVWLNGHKLVPGQLLPEIVGMSVERDRVHLKWFDIGLGKVISLTLRPNQTYDVTSGLLLSGERVE